MTEEEGRGVCVKSPLRDVINKWSLNRLPRNVTNHLEEVVHRSKNCCIEEVFAFHILPTSIFSFCKFRIILVDKVLQILECCATPWSLWRESRNLYFFI